MLAKTLLAKLPERLREIRSYAPLLAYAEMLTEEYERMERVQPNPSCIRPAYNNAGCVTTAADMALMVAGKQGDLAARWRFALPPDYLDFCYLFNQYVLVTRNAVKLLSAEEIEETTLGLREGESVPKSAPYRLFRFARVLGEPENFAFRWRDDLRRMDVVLVNYSTSAEVDVFGPEAESFHSDETFTDWFERMVKSDGYPLLPGSDLALETVVERVR